MSDTSSDTSGSDSESVFTSFGDREEEQISHDIGRNEDWYMYTRTSLCLKNTTKIPFKINSECVDNEDLVSQSDDEWEFRDKVCLRCESEKFFQLSFKLTPAKDGKNAMMTICLRAAKTSSRLEITRIETFSMKMTFTSTPRNAVNVQPVVKYAQIENADEMMETIENIEIENPEIFLSIGSFCSLAEVQKFLHVDARNKASWEHNVPSGDFEPGSEFIKMDIEINAHFDVFFEPDEAKVMKTGDFEFSIARHTIKALGKPSCWAKKMLADNFTDAVFHVGEEGTDFPTTVKAHKSVLSARSPVFAAMYTTDMEEKSTGIVKLPGMSVLGMQAFLEFLYETQPTEPYFDSSKICLEVMQLAHKYQITELVDHCVRQLTFTRIHKLTVQDALGMFTLAHRFEYSDLQSRALLFLSRCKEKFRLQDNKQALRRFMADENDIAPDLISSLFCYKNELWYEPVD